MDPALEHGYGRTFVAVQVAVEARGEDEEKKEVGTRTKSNPPRESPATGLEQQNPGRQRGSWTMKGGWLFRLRHTCRTQVNHPVQRHLRVRHEELDTRRLTVRFLHDCIKKIAKMNDTASLQV